MSLDGYIAKDDNSIGRLFDWLQNGDVEFLTRTGSGDMAFHLSQSSGLTGETGHPESVPWSAGGRCST
jgi:ketosteroid isomerase-like protein